MDWIALILALMMIESGGKLDAIGDNGKAIGVLQIRQECLDDFNRFQGMNYTLEDVKDPRISVAVCRTYLIKYGEKLKEREGREPTYEDYARMWNGGPLGYKKDSTIDYWKKVSPRLTSYRWRTGWKFRVYGKIINDGGY